MRSRPTYLSLAAIVPEDAVDDEMETRLELQAVSSDAMVNVETPPLAGPAVPPPIPRPSTRPVSLTVRRARTRPTADRSPTSTGSGLAPIPATEGQRLAEVYASQLLDTGPERRFDRFTELALDVLDADFSTLSLVDRDRTWMKSQSQMLVQEVPRNTSLCAHAILERELLVVEDTHADPRFAQNPWVIASPYVRFYAGAVVRGPTGQALGALAVYSSKPRQLDERMATRLMRLAALAEKEIQSDQRAVWFRAKMARDAYYDRLTGLPNRRLCRDRLIHDMRWASGVGRRIAVIRADIDQFGVLNTTLGRAACDEILIETSRRLSHEMGESCTVGRWQDDEFVVLVPSLDSKTGASEAVLSVTRAIERSISQSGRTYQLTAKVGASVFPDDGEDADELFANAGAALRNARGASGGRSRFYTASFDAAAARRFHIERRLRAAVDQNLFEIVYQPKVSVATRHISGVEALMRWEDPELGTVGPDEFIPIAEETGLIVPIGEWVLKQACKHNRIWQRNGCRPINVAVNVASQQLQDPQFASRVQNALAEARLEPRYLSLEVTEGSLVADTEATIEKMEALSALGVEFSIDDFGTGYSSLSYLRRLPIKTLKIDRAFVTDMVDNANDAAIVQTIIAMARSLDLRVIAEGVENREQALFLRAYRCDEIQGFLYSPPIPVLELAKMLSADEPFTE